ncbi:MAG: TonB-dependent receptor [Flavobacteriales bacterium]|nr:MAG: TonB-dependent receptor [Flavobacteriales bacterium]
MRKSVVLAMALAVPVLAGAQTRITGTIKSGEGEALEGALVSIDGTVLLTNRDGAFTSGVLKQGRVAMSASYFGFVPVDTTVVVGSTGNATVNFSLRPLSYLLPQAEVRALRAGDRTPFVKNTVDAERLQRTNTGVDMPLLLDHLPSVVTTTDAGTGFGYTGLRIRGSDATRINVTVNGVPINDAESQGMYWVDMPDLATSTQDIEVQRGVGSSTNGPGAFGASVNVRTTTVSDSAFGAVSVSGGSFNTQRYAARFGTGVHKGLSLDGRLSTMHSDGYIDRASADLNSYFLQGAWLGKSRSLRFITFSGKEVTYQAWGGVPREVIDTNRTFNPYTYDNEVDDYRQTYYQLLFDQEVGAKGALNITLFRTLGKGFYEQFREDDDLANYGIAPVIAGGDTITTSDIIRRRWLDNVITGLNASYEQRMDNLRLVLGGSYSKYEGDHFGEVIWARYAGEGGIRDRYYFNDAVKTDMNAFLKATWTLHPRIDLHADAQVRSVNHDFLGYDNELRNVTQQAAFTFFNPKAGVNVRVRKNDRLYASFAVANREPNRDDLTETSPQSRPRPEQMQDIEAGYELRSTRLTVGINGYYMNYKDQLVLTGELNDVGAALRTNVTSSYRAGVELMCTARLHPRLLLSANATLSRNRVRDFTEYVDDWDNGGQVRVEQGETDLAFSPNAIAGGELTATLWRSQRGGRVDLTWAAKYVGQQFLDNTGSVERSLDAYLVNDARLNITVAGVGPVDGIDINLTVRNLFSEEYESNGWVYSYYSESRRQEMVGLFPQAPLNVLGGVTVRF